MTGQGIILGLNGKARSGKDTVADYLTAHYGFVRVAFADELKRSIQRWYGFNDEQVWGERKEEPDLRYLLEDGTYLSGRKAAQLVGTEVGRRVYKNTWVRYFDRVRQALFLGTHTYDMKKGLVSVPWYRRRFHRPPVGIVAPDARFDTELTYIDVLPNAYTWRIKRPSAQGIVGIIGHASETEMDSIPDTRFDEVLNNNSSLVNLFIAVDGIMRMMKVPKQVGKAA